jgi:hypothetical protein
MEIEQHGSFSIHLALLYVACRSACSHEERAQRAYGHDTMAACNVCLRLCWRHNPFLVTFSPFFSLGLAQVRGKE